MALLNNNGFILGMLVISVMYAIHVANALLCVIYRIKILQFSFFFAPFFRLHRRVINGIEFTLGWLPLGGFVKPLGYQVTEEEMNEVKPGDRPYAAFTKPGYLKVIFSLIPFIVTFAAMLIALSVFKDSPPASSAVEVYHYIVTAVRAIFTDSIPDKDFIALTSATTEGGNIIAFELILVLTVVCFSYMLNTLMIALASTGGTVRGAKMIVLMAIYLLFFWAILWKVPAFILSFITFSQALINVASFMLGAFATGVVLYFAAMPFATLLPAKAVASAEVLQENTQD